MPSRQLASIQTWDNKLDDLHAHICFNRCCKELVSLKLGHRQKPGECSGLGVDAVLL